MVQRRQNLCFTAEAREPIGRASIGSQASRPMQNLVASDVYEPFAGSGTTLIAPEQLGRRCLAIEIEPRYVQIAIDRWDAFTGTTVDDGVQC